MTRRRASKGEPAVLVRNLGARMREVGGRDGTIGQDARRQTGQRRLHAGVATRLKGIREGPALGLAAKAVCALTCVCVCEGVQVLSPCPRPTSPLPVTVLQGKSVVLSRPRARAVALSRWNVPAVSPCRAMMARYSFIGSISLSFLTVRKITGHRPAVVVSGAGGRVVMSAWGGRQQTSETSRLVLRAMRRSADVTCFLIADPRVGAPPLRPGLSLSLVPHAAPSPCFPTPTPTPVPPGNSSLPPQLQVSPRRGQMPGTAQRLGLRPHSFWALRA